MARKSKEVARDWLDELPLVTVVLKRTVEFHRNIAGTVFPDRLSAEQLKAVRDRVLEVFEKNPKLFPIPEKPVVGEDSMFDQFVDGMLSLGVVTPRILEHRDGAALLSALNGMLLSVNDEDHIVVSDVEGTFADLFKRVEPVVEKIGAALPFAQSAEYGFLSANPDLVGTGVQFSCVFSFLGLYLSKEIDQVLRGLERLGYEVRPMYVQRDKEEVPIDAPGFCYKVTTLQSVGSAEEIAERMDRVCSEVARQEMNARYRSLRVRPFIVEDFVRRAVGVGNTAVLLTEGEALDILHTLMFGIDLGVLDSDDDPDDLMGVTTLMMRSTVEMLVADRADFPRDPLISTQFARAMMLRDITTQFMPQCGGCFEERPEKRNPPRASGRKAKAK